jgi:hypothetical protein
MNVREEPKRVLALDLRPRSFGYVVFEGPDRLLDWGVRSFRRGVNAVRIPRAKKLATLLEESMPSAVVLQKSWSHAKNNQKRSKALDAALRVAKKTGTAVRLVGSHAVIKAFGSQGHLTKYQVASAVAERFPELAVRLPPQRKPWQSEDYRMSIFDAAALGVAFFAKKAEGESSISPPPS